jgi:hypothetical protein
LTVYENHLYIIEMAKQIQSPIECGHRVGNLVCFHPDKDGKPLLKNCKAKGENNFPSICPLENVDHMPKTIDEIIEVLKREGLLFDIKKPTLRYFRTITIMEKGSNINYKKLK